MEEGCGVWGGNGGDQGKQLVVWSAEELAQFWFASTHVCAVILLLPGTPTSSAGSAATYQRHATLSLF